ncbi:MAG TPA: DUF3570 domain-containing protein [Sulfurimonas sp.]|nr:DUF3570 domain-containing protein [Sulfurimonas sp.]
MQLKLSMAAASLIVASTLQAEDYVSVQYMQYDESNNRTSISAPALTVNKDFGTDYTLNISLVSDAVSGASPTAIDTSSGASGAFKRGETTPDNVSYENIDYKDNRLAGNILLTTRFENRDELTVGIAYSQENDFYSYEASGEYLHWLGSDKNQALSFGLAVQSNEILVRECGPYTSCDTSSGASAKETASLINTQLSFLQNIDSNSYAKASVFFFQEDGYLSSPYHNIVRQSKTTPANVIVESELKPDTRTSYGLSLDYANAITKNTTFQTTYRFYTDDWGINSHTLDNDLYYELGTNWTFKLGLRLYSQSEADFYSEFKNTGSFTNENFASSDERVSSFTSMTYKTGVDYKVSKDIVLNIGANYYTQDTVSKLSATYFIAGFTYYF